MTQLNKERCYVRILREICQEEGIRISSYSGEWAFLLQKEGRRAFILGYQFGLNPSSVQQICTDKNIASEILREAGVASVYHSCYMSPRLQGYVGKNGNWAALIRELEEKKELVCKDNCGTGGNEVYRVRSRRELEDAAYRIFSIADSMAVCAFEEILEEYRLVMLDGRIRLAFSKIRPSLTGDGNKTLGELFAEKVADGEAAELLIPSASELAKVPAKGEQILLNWKHNLGQGAKAQKLDESCLPSEVYSLAESVCQALTIRFASVDVIRTAQGWKVLEVNSGVMMEHFAGTSEEYYRMAKAIYRDAVLEMLQK